MGRFLSPVRSSTVSAALVASGTAASLVALISASGATAFAATSSPGTRANPYPRGHKAMVEKFAISVLGVDTNAWPTLKRASPANVAPKPGMTYVLVTLRAKNQGRTASIPLVDGIPAAVGRFNRVYSPFEGCGTIPNDIANLSGVAPGHTVNANTCWAVRKTDLPSLVMFYDPYSGGKRIYFALHYG